MGSGVYLILQSAGRTEQKKPKPSWVNDIYLKKKID